MTAHPSIAALREAIGSLPFPPHKAKDRPRDRRRRTKATQVRIDNAIRRVVEAAVILTAEFRATTVSDVREVIAHLLGEEAA